MLSKGCGSIVSCPCAIVCGLDSPSTIAANPALTQLIPRILVLRELPVENTNSTLPE
jgi:hypothetical protein